MTTLLEYVGFVHIYLGPYRGNPIALYLKRNEKGCEIGPRTYPWNDVRGIGETPNKAAADFEEKWKGKGLAADMYSGPAWEGGIKPEKPAPSKPAVSPKPPVAPAVGAPTSAASAASAAAPAAKATGSTVAKPAAPLATTSSETSKADSVSPAESSS